MPAGMLTQGLIQAGQGVVGAGMGLLLGGVERKKQLEQQKKLQELEIQGQQQMTAYNMQKQLELWKATGYGAQKDQLKEAGLNPGLMYGMGGGGGQTSSIAGGHVGAGQAAAAGPAAGMGMAMGTMQLALLKAQKENIEADTANKEGDTLNKPKVGANLDASTGNLLQGINNAKAQEELTKIQTSMAAIQDEIMGKTQTAAIAQILTGLRSATAAMDMLERNNDIDAATKQSKIDMIKAQAIGAGLANMLTQAQTGATQQSTEESKAKVQQMQHQIHNWATEIAQEWTKLDQTGKELKLKAIDRKMLTEAGYDFRGTRMAFDEKELNALIDKIMKGE